DDPFHRARITGALEARGFRMTLGGSQNDALDYSLGLGGGGDGLRQGIEARWRHAPRGGRVADWRYGFLSRPTAWLSVGGVVDHVGQPSFAGARLDRAYDWGLGIRPFALSGTRAHTLGTRLTLTVDARLDEVQRFDATAFRVGGELELVPGLALRGSYEDHTHATRVGFAFAGIRSRIDG